MMRWIVRDQTSELAEAFCDSISDRLRTNGPIPEDGSTRTPTNHQPLQIALTGGASARVFYSAMARRFANAYQSGPDSALTWWQPEYFSFYWSDERLVPPQDPDSNYRLAYETLFEPAHIGAEHTHRIRTEASDPASDYVELLKSRLPLENAVPSFPILILGLGEDAHTGSLFPGTNIYEADDQLVRKVHGTNDHPHDRISFTPKLMNAANEVWFVITGEQKAEAVEKLYQRKLTPKEAPCLAVDPQRTKVTCFVDGPAAARLPDRERNARS